MDRLHADDRWLLRLDRGEDVLAILRAFARSHAIGHASISGIGAIEAVTLGAYDLERREYLTRKLEGGFEVLSLSGNLAWIDDEPFPHIHVVLGDRNGECVGGHLFEGTVHITLELFVHPSRERVTRGVDDATGLKVWRLGKDRRQKEG
jgi:predicted DNA-binding protein with PD1-like motif